MFLALEIKKKGNNIMKIECGTGIDKPGVPEKLNGKSISGGNFQKIFEQQLDKDSHVIEANGQVKEAYNTRQILRPCLLKGQTVSSVLEKLEVTIDRLENYRKCLSNPKNTLKLAGKLLQKVTDDVEVLKTMSGTIDDKQLEAIIQETVTTVVTEEARFRRGDYL